MALFDGKAFNAEAFKYLMGRVPNTKLNELVKSKALVGNSDITSVFSSQNGTSYAKIIMKGLIDGTAQNYDGETDLTSTTTKTFEQGVVVVGRMKAWYEKDFSVDITGGVDFMDNIAQQVVEYWSEVDQDTILATLKGVFAMTGTENLKFVNGHTTDVTATGDGVLTPTTLNSATAKACGDNKKKFTLVLMHSTVATNIENLNLLSYLKYTDKDGVQRDLGLATWNGKLVLIDDAMPTEEVEAVGTEGQSGYEAAYTSYTTYVLGDGSISYADIGAEVPIEKARDPFTGGGKETLITRQRKVFAPYGLSYTKSSQAKLSPTDTELGTGSNWSLVHTGESTASQRTYIQHKAIPIARIVSKG